MQSIKLPLRVNKWIYAALALLFLALVGVMAFRFLAQQGKAAPSLTTPAKAAPAPAPNPSPKPQMPPAASPRSGEPVHRALNSQTTLGDLTRMRGQRQLLEQAVKIQELQKKLEELQAPPVRREIDLPALTPPKKGGAAPAPAPVVITPAPAPSRGPVVLSVQGAAGKLSATIRMSDGRTVTVNNGAAFAGGKLSVGRRGVFVNRGGKQSSIPFE